MSTNTSPVIGFGQYGRSFQEKIVQALLSDRVWAEQVLEVFDVNYLEVKYLAFLAERYFGHAKKYKVFPTLQLLITIIRDELKVGTDAILREQIIDYLTRMRANPDPGDLQFVKEKTLDFCRKQALKIALSNAVEQMHAEKYEQIVESIKKAVIVGTTPALGLEFFEDHESRFTLLQRNAIPTGLDEIDRKDILNGGLGAGEIGIVVAATGVGKCTNKQARICIKYVSIKINGNSYRPWDRVPTRRGLIHARDVVESDDVIIEHHDVTETIEIGDLFSQVGFNVTTVSTDGSGDSFINNEWGIEALSLDGYYPIEGFRWTKPESQVRLFHRTSQIGVLEDCVPYLQCSPEHIVLRQGENPGWVKVSDLKNGDVIVGRKGLRVVSEVQRLDEVERLCDLQVAIAHSYFTDNVLSHNSHFLTMLGANALRRGVNVLHYTLELSESNVGLRYDSNLCDIDSNTVIENKELVLAKYKEAKMGRLIIKEFPTNSATIYTLRAHIERLEVKGFQPGMIIIDYADIMRSTRQYDSLRHELKLIYEELRGFASEKKVPIWSASQSNKEGSSAEVVDLSNMSEAYGKAMVADVVLSISRKAFEKSSGHGRLYVAKNRAGRDGLQYPCMIDTARSKFAITGDAAGFQEAVADDVKAQKQQLRDKWEELQREKLVSRKVEPEKKHE